MPGLPLVARETTCSRSRTADQMCRQNSRTQLSPEEALAAEESLSVYCKPVELYNILQRRALHNPPFLQRCLHYKMQARHRHRIQLTISLSANMNDEAQLHSLFPLYILLARPVVDAAAGEHSAVYRLSRVRILPTFSEIGRRDQTEASFVIPEVRKLLADARSRNLTIILLSHGEGSSSETRTTDGTDAFTFPSKLEGNCTWGKLPLESLFSSPEKYENLKLGQSVEMLSTLDLHPSILEPTFLDVDSCLTLQTPQNFGAMKTLYQVKFSISAHEGGAGERSPYDSYTYDDVPTSSLSHIIRLRAGNVIFNYKYYNNTLQKTEVTEDFSCPFCLVRCASYKGLRCHLTSSHDLFNFEFWVTEEYQAVNVSVKTDIWRSEIVADGVDPRLQTFCYWSRLNRRRRRLNLVQNVNHVHPHAVKSDSPKVLRDISHASLPGKDKGITDAELLNGGPSTKEEECSRANYKFARYGSEVPPLESTEQLSCNPGTVSICAASAQAPVIDEYNLVSGGNNHTTAAMLQFAKSRKLSVERADPRNRVLLQKRQFFHSHRAQPMALEQVLSDRDSEDEVDDDIADFEDRRMLDDFVDVTKDEKQIMHLWNSFVRKQRVLADGHIPWACEAFTKLHGPDFVREPALMWCWRLFMIKLWNHSLLDARTMNNCNLLLEKYQNEGFDPKQS